MSGAAATSVWPRCRLRPAARLSPPAPPALHRRVAGTAAAQVCRRWNTVFYSDSCLKLWQHFTWKFDPRELGNEQLMAADLRLFKRIGHLIERTAFAVELDAHLQRAAAQHLPSFLATLNPTVLTSLAFVGVPLRPGAVQALGQFRQLRALDIVAAATTARMKGLADALGQLASLERLHFRGSCVDTALLAAVCHLPALECLQLHSTDAPLPDLRPLSALAGRLTGLWLLEQTSHAADGLQLPQAAACPKLQQLFIAAPVLHVSLGCLAPHPAFICCCHCCCHGH